jgi:galactokinase
MSTPHPELGAAGALLQAQFGRAPAYVTFAPGRVNLIGEHTDYNDGLVLPCALGSGTAVAIAPRDDRIFRAVSNDGASILAESFPLEGSLLPHDGDHWGNYLRGVTKVMHDAGVDMPGADIAIVGSVPQGAGLSSSASLCVAIARALLTIAEPDPVRDSSGRIDVATIARWAQWSEHHFAGCHCGIMDQMAAAACVSGEAMFLDCRSLEYRAVALPSSMTILIAHSGVPRRLVAGEYNLRRMQCEQAAVLCGKTSLRDASQADLQTLRAIASETLLRRARHVISENERVLTAVGALERGDIVTLGRCFRESHASLRDDFEVSVPEVDRLVEHLEELIQQHADGQGGARMTGGGFGGCVVAVIAKDAAADITTHLASWLRSRLRTPPLLLTVSASA